MLTPNEISHLTPAQVQAGCDQIDQNIVRVLQKIDEDFAQCVQILTERLLPAVAVYGENSQQIWESVKVRRRLSLANVFFFFVLEEAKTKCWMVMTVLEILFRGISEHKTDARLRWR